jgi:uncharacterized membrane protein
MKIDSVLLGILAVIAGILILGRWLSLELIVGIYLIIFGVLTLIRRA